MSKKSVKRWSAKRKQEVVLRLLRGESLGFYGGFMGTRYSITEPRMEYCVP